MWLSMIAINFRKERREMGRFVVTRAKEMMVISFGRVFAGGQLHTNTISNVP